MLISLKKKLKQVKNTNLLKAAVICGISLAGSRAFAQNGFEFGLSYMIQKSALFNKSDMNAGPELNQANTIDYLGGGVTAAYKVNRHFAVEMDVLLSRQGQKYTGNDMMTPNNTAYNSEVAFQAVLNNKETTGDYQAKAELNCVKIPFLFKFTTNNTKRMFYTLSAGPQANLMKSAVFEVNKEDVTLPGTDITPNDVYRRITVDGVMALGMGFNLSRHFALSTQLRFDYGFQDVEKKDATFSYEGGPQEKYYDDGRAATHNATAALMVGLSYKL